MSKNNNWLWWAFGSVALIGVGVGTYMYIKNKKAQEMPRATNPPEPPSTNTGTNPSSGMPIVNPFKDENEVKAFQSWANSIKNSGLKVDGKYGPKTDAEYRKYFKEYIIAVEAQNAPNLIEGWSKLKEQMLDKKVWGNNSSIDIDTAGRLRFAINVDGSTDVYVNFIPSGYFWVEIGNGTNKFGGTWTYRNNLYTLKLDDGSWNMSDNEVSEMIKQILKMKYPAQMKYYSFSENKSNIDEVMNFSGKNYLDSQDSML